MTRTWHVWRSRVLCTSNLHRLCNRTCPKRARRAEERGGKRAERKTEVRRGVSNEEVYTREKIYTRFRVYINGVAHKVRSGHKFYSQYAIAYCGFRG